MKTTIVVLLGLAAGVLMWGLLSIDIDVDVNSQGAQAQNALPGNVTKFEDAGYVCYILKADNVWLETSYSGISCVNK